MTKTWIRWLPAGIVPVVIAAGAIVMPMQASASVQLADKSPEQVLSLVANSSVKAFSGTIEQTSDLGLPELPSGGASTKDATGSALELLTGTHTARVFVDGPQKARIQVLDSLAERDVVRNGSDVWLYNSKSNAVTHITLPAHEPMPTPRAVPTPTDLAKELLAKLDSSTKVSVGSDTTVAGRTAYDLILTPRAADTLIGSVSIAVDSRTGLPLSVDVQARGQKSPAFSVEFSSITLGAPDAERFEFTPPAGAKVTEHALPAHDGTKPYAGQPNAAQPNGAMQHSVTGTGWDAVVQAKLSAAQLKSLDSPLLSSLSTKVAGGRLISSSLVNILLTDDGRVFVGSVSAARLQDVAAGR